jgi:hypothetical protein
MVDRECFLPVMGFLTHERRVVLVSMLLDHVQWLSALCVDHGPGGVCSLQWRMQQPSAYWLVNTVSGWLVKSEAVFASCGYCQAEVRLVASRRGRSVAWVFVLCVCLLVCVMQQMSAVPWHEGAAGMLSVNNTM